MTCQSLSSQDKLNLESWGLPTFIVQKYKLKGLTSMFPWQLECLTSGDVISGGNLVYSAPTSAGKTLVAEIITLQTVLERKKKVIIILPFVSVVREKMLYFKDLLAGSGIRVEGFMGSYNPPGGFRAVHVAICTIEKANALINRLLEENNFDNIGCVVVDELHLLGDPHRGYLLELLLTKLRYISTKGLCPRIQIIGMSATLPNLDVLAKWLDATLYKTDFRPIPLTEYLKVNRTLFKTPELSNCGDITPEFTVQNDQGDVIYLCVDTIIRGFSILVFCPTKNWCESLAMQIAGEIKRLGCGSEEVSSELRKQLNSEAISDTLGQLKNSPVGLENVLGKCISFGVAFHHAGLTLDERDIIEGGFKTGTLRVLVATSTLSAGVNLPARRVIVRSPLFGGNMMDVRSYKQMVGRAGRMGKDTAGESFLLCTDENKSQGERLVTSDLPPVESSLGNSNLSNSLKRAILEVIASGLITTYAEVECYARCTMLAAYEDPSNINEAVQKCVKYLTDKGFIDLKNETEISASSLAEACLSASMTPDQGLTLLAELDKARKCFVLESDLHAVYQVTPFSVSNQWALDWMKAFSIWDTLPKGVQKVGHLVGVEDRFLIRAMRGTTNFQADHQRMAIHKRFFTALALQDLINEIPLNKVVEKYGCNKGMLQSLQQSAATFSGMVTNFCRKLGWGALEVVVSQLGQRIQFGAHRDLLDLLKLECTTGVMARSLYNCGITTVAELAQSTMKNVEAAIRKALPYSNSQEGECERQKKDVYLPGRPGLTVVEAAELFIQEARTFIMREMGVDHVEWNDAQALPNVYDMTTINPSSRDISLNNLEKSVASADFENLNGSVNHRIGLLNQVESCNTAEISKPESTPANDNNDESQTEMELNLALSDKDTEKTDGNEQSRESDEEFVQDDVSKFPSLMNISNPCISKLPVSPAVESESDCDVVVSESEELVPTSQDDITMQNSGTRRNCSLLLRPSSKAPSECKNIETNKTTCRSPSFSGFFDDSFTRESPVERSTKFKVDVKSSTPIMDKKGVTYSQNMPESGVHRLQPPKSPTSLPVQANDFGAINLSDSDMFNNSFTIHKRLSSSMICAIHSDQPLEEFDSNWGGDSLLIASQVIESLKEDSPCLKRKFNEDPSPQTSDNGGSTRGESKRKCILSLVKTNEKSGSFSKTHCFAGSFVLNSQTLKIIDEDSAPLKFHSVEANIEQVDTPPAIDVKFPASSRKNSLTDSLLAEIFQDSFRPQDDKMISNPGTPELFESPGKQQSRPAETKSSNNIILNLPCEEEQPVTSLPSPAPLLSTSTTPTKIRTVASPVKYSPLDISIVKCSKSPGTSPSGKLKVQKQTPRQSRNRQSSCKKSLILPPHRSNALNMKPELIPIEGDGKSRVFADELSKSKKFKKHKSETWGRIDSSSSELITRATLEPCSAPTDSESANIPSTPSKLSGPVDLSSIGDALEICSEHDNLQNFMVSIKEQKAMAMCLETSQYSSNENKIGVRISRSKTPAKKEPDFHDSSVAIVGIYFTVGINVFHCCLRSSKCVCVEKLKMIFKMRENCVIGYDLSWQIKLLHKCCDIVIDCQLWDVCVADWLLDPRDGKISLKQLAKNELASEELAVANLQKIPCASDCIMIWGLKKKLLAKLEKHKLLETFTEVEMPLRRLLVYMELTGMPFDHGIATQLWNRVRETMENLEDQIYSKARTRFSLSSRKDLKKVKESLNIKPDDIQHPMMVNIRNWRKLSSLKTRNLSQLLMTQLSDGRCRGQSCSFTMTGRIIMHNPNLQHIPRDFTIGNELFSLRSAFIAKPGNAIISADYSQLELRILAHFSQDSDLLSSINNEADVFISIAAKWNNIPLDEVTDDIRQQTKQIIYGIIYGMGDRALGDALGIDPPEAALLAAKFRRSYPGVQRFIDNCVADCQKRGYVTTLMGRVRHLKGILSSDRTLRAQAERQAVNSTIQGSAADIAKSATLRVEYKLSELIKKRGPVLTPLSASHLILHLHDELIYEVSNEYLEVVKEVLKTEMANAVQLKVALPVVVKCGTSWGTLKKL